MSKKRSKKKEVKVETVQVDKPKIAYQAWFLQKVSARKMRDHQEYALFIFFKKQGLTELEEYDTYEQAFIRF